MVGKTDSVSSVSASACHIGRPNYVGPGEILLVYGIPHTVNGRTKEGIEIWVRHVSIKAKPKIMRGTQVVQNCRVGSKK